MSPLNQCIKEKKKLEQAIKAIRSELEAEKGIKLYLMHLASKDRLMRIMYSSLFKKVLSSIEEDLANAGTLKESRQWISETIERFKPAFDVGDVDDEESYNNAVEAMGVEFNRESLVQQYNQIFAEIAGQESVKFMN